MSNNPSSKGYESQLPNTSADVKRQAAARKGRVNSAKLRIGWGNGTIPMAGTPTRLPPGDLKSGEL